MAAVASESAAAQAAQLSARVPAGSAPSAQAARPRLHYFAGWGLAEQTRWLLAAWRGEHEFEQVVLHERSEMEALLREGRLLFRQLPLLEMDGLQIVQSQAMVRHVARAAGLAGRSAEEQTVVDMVCETVKDVRTFVLTWVFKPEAERAAHAREAAGKVAAVFPGFEALIGAKGGVCASGLSAADVLLAECMYELRGNILPDDAFDAYPGCSRVLAKVLALPNIQQYLASDKRFPFPAGRVGELYVANVSTVLGR
jgi:glutathione S-transferase